MTVSTCCIGEVQLYSS